MPKPTHTSTIRVGDLLRSWRLKRRVSQLQLAAEAEVSQRHLSFIESGRSVPSREMLLRLAEALSIPLRERNQLLMAAGFAPHYQERQLDDPALDAAREVIERLIKGHEPYPALAVDRHWNLVMANAALTAMISGVDEALLRPPVNVLRLSLHPDGMASRIVNYREWRAHILARLNHQLAQSADPELGKLLNELKTYPVPLGSAAYLKPRGLQQSRSQFAGIAIPLTLKTPVGEVSFLSTTTVFGTPVDISLAELAIESFFPADAASARAIREMSPGADG